MVQAASKIPNTIPAQTPTSKTQTAATHAPAPLSTLGHSPQQRLRLSPSKNTRPQYKARHTQEITAASTEATDTACEQQQQQRHALLPLASPLSAGADAVTTADTALGAE